MNGPSDFKDLRQLTFRDLLLGTQIAICTVLVMASLVATLGMVRSLRGTLGSKPEGAVLVEIDFREMRLSDADILKTEKAMSEEVGRIPGVTAVGTASSVPMAGGIRGVPVFDQDTTNLAPNDQVLDARVYPISPDYLEASGTRLIDGRCFLGGHLTVALCCDCESNLCAEDVD